MIEVNNLIFEKIDKKKVELIIKETLEKEGFKDDKEISVAFISKEDIKKINSKYRKINDSTDVLSFEGEGDILGEIIISVEETKKNGDIFEDELKRVLIHGTLHLLGYDHEKDCGEMIKKQEQYFSLIKN